MHKMKDRLRARDLFVERGMRYDEIAAEMGVLLATLKSWGMNGKWGEARAEHERLIEQLHGKILKTIQGIVEAISREYEADAPSSQAIFAHCKAVESLMVVAAYAGKDLRTVLDAVGVLNEKAAVLRELRKAAPIMEDKIAPL